MKYLFLLLTAVVVFQSCKKCKSVGTSSAPEVAIIDSDTNSLYYNQNIGYLKFDIQQRENDGGECGKWAAQLGYVIHNNTNKIVTIHYTVNFANITQPWAKADSAVMQPLTGINKDVFSNVGADYTNAVITVTPTSISYQ